ncbi:hypothetical protein [Thalassobius sp. Cn5-15]|uniref:hypothetical protein n=1 Tax=Thalassobius sp. Cn5-15 TaxID=2917763 RepID=UPI001EF17F06|nr:hypothetical protein [Thalassobius sp. Cn5-15]MCG7494918.1 hypothetical protein [Thalassobius sp. Cn5-15]
MSPLLLLLLAVPVAFGLMISDAVMSFVEDLEEATALPPDGQGGGERDDPPVQEVARPAPDGTLGLFDLLATASGVGQTQVTGGEEEDLLAAIVLSDVVKTHQLETDLGSDPLKCGVEPTASDPFVVEQGADQLALLFQEEAGGARSMMAELILRYDRDADATTLEAGDQVLIALAGDQTALSLALQATKTEGGPHWMDVDGQDLSAAEVATADLLLIACQHCEQPQIVGA